MHPGCTLDQVYLYCERAPLAAGLPRVDVLHDVPVADRTYPP